MDSGSASGKECGTHGSEYASSQEEAQDRETSEVGEALDSSRVHSLRSQASRACGSRPRDGVASQDEQANERDRSDRSVVDRFRSIANEGSNGTCNTLCRYSLIVV